MKPSVKPSKVIENAKEFNLTDEYLTDFMDIWRQTILIANAENRSYTNITNGTLEDANPQQAVSCDDYCKNEMRHFFDEYRNYHGYVSLVVSTRNLITKFNSGAEIPARLTLKQIIAIMMRFKLL